MIRALQCCACCITLGTYNALSLKSKPHCSQHGRSLILYGTINPSLYQCICSHITSLRVNYTARDAMVQLKKMGELLDRPAHTPPDRHWGGGGWGRGGGHGAVV